MYKLQSVPKGALQSTWNWFPAGRLVQQLLESLA
jgi:hypothetical protein